MYAKQDSLSIKDTDLPLEYDSEKIEEFWSNHKAMVVSRLFSIGGKIFPFLFDSLVNDNLIWLLSTDVNFSGSRDVSDIDNNNDNNNSDTSATISKTITRAIKKRISDTIDYAIEIGDQNAAANAAISNYLDTSNVDLQGMYTGIHSHSFIHIKHQ